MSMSAARQIHASCVARDGHGVLLTGPSGAGKSDLALRLIGRGFTLVADDRVEIADGRASPPASLAGLLEVRGFGIVRLPFDAPAALRLVVQVRPALQRLPDLEWDAELGVPLVCVDPALCSAPDRVALALDCALGRVEQIVGTWAA
jgi:HPr kinase/phosphorylase